jgi:vacuolar-type H+-ATPase subunit H
MFRIEDIKTAEMLEQERFDSESQRIRDERDRLIKAEAWRIERYNSEVRQGLEPSDNIVALDAYIQALRDIPEQAGFPWNVEWPVLEVM